MNDTIGSRFLHEKYPDLHTKPQVKECTIVDGKKIGRRASDEILARLNFLEEESIDEGTNFIERILMYHKKSKLSKLSESQKKSLSQRTNYLNGYGNRYPMWAKYWFIESVVKMGSLKVSSDENQNKKYSFPKRSKSTSGPFPVLVQRALAMTFQSVFEYLEQEYSNPKNNVSIKNNSNNLSDDDFKSLISTLNFSKIYAQFISEMPEYNEEGLEEIAGERIRYERGGDHRALSDSLIGYPLDWCVASYHISQGYLKDGDFYIYYSFDKDGKPKIPRVAIAMSGDEICEISGVNEGQGLDPYIGPAIIQKFEEEDFLKVVSPNDSFIQTTKRLLILFEKQKNGDTISGEDISYIYSYMFNIKSGDDIIYLNLKIVISIIESRNIDEDMAFLMENYPEFKIDDIKIDDLKTYLDIKRRSLIKKKSITIKDIVAVLRLIKLGSINVDEYLFEEIQIKLIRGNILRDIEAFDGDIESDIKINGSEIEFYNADSSITCDDRNIEQIDFGKQISLTGNLSVIGNSKLKRIVLPTIIKGDVIIENNDSLEEIIFPEDFDIEGSIFIKGNNLLKKIVLPKNINFEIDVFGNPGLCFVFQKETVFGNSSKIHIEDFYTLLFDNELTIVPPKVIKTHFPKGKLPDILKVILDKYEIELFGVDSLNILSFLDNQGVLDLTSFTGDVDLVNNENVKKLVLANKVIGNINIRGLINCEEVNMPVFVSGNFYISGLLSCNKVVMPTKMEVAGDLRIDIDIPVLLIINKFVSVAGNLTILSSILPQGLDLSHMTMCKKIFLPNLVSSKGLILPEQVKVNVDLSSLPDEEIEDLKLRYPRLKISQIFKQSKI